jgi:hypothetical protein
VDRRDDAVGLRDERRELGSRQDQAAEEDGDRLSSYVEDVGPEGVPGFVDLVTSGKPFALFVGGQKGTKMCFAATTWPSNQTPGKPETSIFVAS